MVVALDLVQSSKCAGLLCAPSQGKREKKALNTRHSFATYAYFFILRQGDTFTAIKN